MAAQQSKKQTGTLSKNSFTENGQVAIKMGDAVPAILLFLFSLVEFIPSGGSGEVLGSQWFYLCVINILSAGWLIINRHAKKNIPGLLNNKAFYCYLLFVILAAVSILAAMNKTESLVAFSRLAVTAIMVINLAILLHKREGVFRYFAFLLSGFLLIQAAGAIRTFYSETADQDISRVILGLTGNAGNKNIFAVSLVLKIPFVAYSIFVSRIAGRIVFSVILAIAAFAVFIINARSAYIGLGLSLLVLVTALFIIRKGAVNTKSNLIILAFIFLPVVAGLFLSQNAIRKIIADQGTTTSYGTVFERLNTISFTAEGSSSRVRMWTNAADYLKKHPIMGCGYGNWQLASIPFERTFVDEVRITKHVHNDFLESFAELGIAGGILYLLVFTFLVIYLLKIILPGKEESKRIMAATGLMGLTVYFTDAMFNFPAERPVTQFFFALLFGLTLALLSSSESKKAAPATNNKTTIIPLVLLVMLLPACYITYSVFRSLAAQSKVNDDIQSATPVTKWDEIRNIFPAIPNLNSYGFPIGDIKAFYLVNEKKYDSALLMLDQNAAVNPHLTLTEYLKAKIYSETGKPDSALLYARKAFYAKPRARSHYEILNSLLAAKKDTSGIDSAFTEYNTYRKEAWAWNRYIEYRAMANPSDTGIGRLVDSALALFPSDTELQQKKNNLQSASKQIIPPAANEDEYQKNFAAGFDLFSKQQYKEAIPYFIKASSLKPDDYLSVENTGLCYYSLLDYNKAISYFEKVLSNYKPADGKSEFLMAISLLNLGKKDPGCAYLKKSMAKGFQQAAEQAARYCQ